MDLHTFTKAFVAELVTRGQLSVHPRKPADRQGFARVVRLLDEKIDELDESGADPLLPRQLVRIANELRPSNTGAFEGFESSLRALQLTFSSCPNPFYEEIDFSVPKPYALATIASLPESEKQLVREAVDSFVQEQSP